MISQKWSDYQLFKQVIDLMKRKEHLTNEGMRSLQKIVSLKSVFFNNKGLSNDLKSAFPQIVPAIRPPVKSKKIMDPN